MYKSISIFYSLLILLFTNTKAHSQNSTIKFYNYKWEPCEVSEARFFSNVEKTDSGWLRHDYFLNSQQLQMRALFKDSACKIRNGDVAYFHCNGNLESKGRVVNDKREGIYILYHFNGMMADSGNYHNGEIIGYKLSWHPNGMMADSIFRKDDSTTIEVSWFDNSNPSSAGYYINDKKHGKWSYFHKNGNIACTEINDHGKVVEVSYVNEDNSIPNDTSNTRRDAEFKGGVKKWQEYLADKTYWPEEYKIVNTNRVVVVAAFTVNEDGKVEDVHVVTPFVKSMDDIAMYAIKKSPDWKPKLDHNRKVKQYLRQPVTFSQEEE